MNGIYSGQLLFQNENKLDFEKITAKYKELFNNEEGQTGKMTDALGKIDMAKTKVSQNHEIQVYFVLAQLAGLKIWSDALNLMDQSLGANKQLSSEQKKPHFDLIFKELEAMGNKKKDYLKLLERKLPGGTKHPTYEFWNKVM